VGKRSIQQVKRGWRWNGLARVGFGPLRPGGAHGQDPEIQVPPEENGGLHHHRLAIVVVILGILAIGHPELPARAGAAKRASCLSTNATSSGDAALLLGQRSAQPPERRRHARATSAMGYASVSSDDDNSDYEITLVDGDITQIVCLVRAPSTC
jgi:hypothetical protein